MTNMLCLVGRLNKEIELIEEKDKKYYKMELAVSRIYKNIDGIYETDIIPIVLWNGIGQQAMDYCNKGDVLGVKGRLQVNNNKLEVIAEKISFLSSKKVENENN